MALSGTGNSPAAGIYSLAYLQYRRMAFLENYSGLKAAAGMQFEFGIGNFLKVVQYKRFVNCLKNTVLLCVLTVPISTILALLIAVALNSIKWLQRDCRPSSSCLM